MELDVLHLDNHLLVVRKSAGTLIQADQTGDISLLEQGKAFLKAQFKKPGEVFLGLVHRLDRPASGVVVFARTSKAASRLSAQFRTRQIEKKYWALVEGQTPERGHLVHHIKRRQSRSRVVEPPDGQRAELSYLRRRYADGISWVEIDLETGRHHQIRVQFSHIGHPLLGDFKYGAQKPFPNRALALHARALTLTHPTTQERMTFVAEPEPFWPRAFSESGKR